MGSTPTAPTKKYMSNVSRRHPQGRPKVIDFENLELGTSTDNVMFYLNMVKNDKSINNEQVVLYLGGRIDDDALYPKSYCSYLNSKIKELNPTKIIAHTPWYAKKYYDKGILDESMKLDMVITYYPHSSLKERMQVINPDGYDREKSWKYLYDLTKDTTYLFYIHNKVQKGSLSIVEKTRLFINNGERVSNFDTTKIKFLLYDRRYFDPRKKNDLNIPWDEKVGFINTTDGFAFTLMFLGAGFKNLNIIGFSAFGSDEDQSRFSKYTSVKHPDGNVSDERFNNKTYFDLATSENQRLESDILKYFCEKGDLHNLENEEELMKALRL